MNLQDEPVRVHVERVTPWAHTLSPDPIDVGPEEALREVLCEFEDHAYSCYSATAWVRPGDGTGGRAIVFRRPRHVLHVIGTSKLAECFRELLRDGVAGWTLHPMPATRTLLQVAEPTLGHRTYNLLTREGFTTGLLLPGAAMMHITTLGRLLTIGPTVLHGVTLSSDRP